MASAEDLLVEDGDVLEEREEIHFLLVTRADEVVVGLTRQGEHRRAVHLRVVEAVEQMNRAGPGGRKADAEPTGVFRVAAGHERRGLFVSHLHEREAVLPRAQALP